MYKSPIEFLIDDACARIMYDAEEHAFRAIQNVGINIDKDELIRALEYDRAQYEKGFLDGVELAQKWIPVTERLPEDGKEVLIWVGSYHDIGWWEEKDRTWRSDFLGDCSDDVTHWMPLPKPPKEDEG